MAIRINKSWVVLGVSLVLGLGAAFIATRYLNDRVAQIEAQERNKATVKVVVATENLPKGAKISATNVAVREFPAEWSNSGAITPDQFGRADNSALAYPAMRGEAIMWSQLEGQRAPSFSARLTPGRRAVTVPVDEISSVSGMVDPGDLIDVMVSVKKDSRNITFPMLQGVTVLATGTRVGPDPASSDGKGQRTFTTITLDTTPDDARRIIAAREVGKVTALLRAPGDRETVSAARTDALTLLGLADPPVIPRRANLGPSSVPVIYGGNRIENLARLDPRGGEAQEGAASPSAMEELLRALQNQAAAAPSAATPGATSTPGAGVGLPSSRGTSMTYPQN